MPGWELWVGRRLTGPDCLAHQSDREMGNFQAHCGFPAQQSHRPLVEQDDL